MQRPIRIAVIAASVVSGTAAAQPMQHDHEHMDHEHMDMHEHAAMATPLGIADTRDASGTSWQPDSTPMFMWHWMTGGWSLALHENLFAGYAAKSSDRGDDKVTSINWVMAMARHAVGRGDIQLRTMLSLEPLTVGDEGYPLLLQTGEGLVDRQHAHDLFMELAARFRQPIGNTVGVELYVAPSGEPAIGPAAFPHRFTSMANPFAPLSHHWQDSTHISFGVVTAGVFTERWKLEGSWFNGREPDDKRYDLDLRTPDSFAARLTFNPTADLSAQASWARLDSPEEPEPDISVQRVTASVAWNRRTGDRDLALLGVIGRNAPSMGAATTAGLAEGAYTLGDHTVLARGELLEKTGGELALPPGMADRAFGMASLTAGYVYDVTRLGQVVPGIGAVVTLDIISSGLEPFYGTRTPWGGMVFVRLRPPEMAHRM